VLQSIHADTLQLFIDLLYDDTATVNLKSFSKSEKSSFLDLIEHSFGVGMRNHFAVYVRHDLFISYFVSYPVFSE